jgi:hypothetical protein
MVKKETNMQYNYNKKRWINLISVLIISTFIGCTATGGGVHIDWGDKPQYYPYSSVYFDTYRKVYFYIEGNMWRMSVSLPQEIHVKLGDHVSIEMDIDKPYIHYEEHKHKYPPGQLKKKGKKKW